MSGNFIFSLGKLRRRKVREGEFNMAYLKAGGNVWVTVISMMLFLLNKKRKNVENLSVVMNN